MTSHTSRCECPRAAVAASCRNRNKTKGKKIIQCIDAIINYAEIKIMYYAEVFDSDSVHRKMSLIDR
jgi:hypothetical protein